ncbi:MAG: cell division protein FtsX [Novosphingobium sp.]
MNARVGSLAAALSRRFAFPGGERGQQLLPQARLGGPMPWVIAIMIMLTTVAAAGGLALSNVAGAARGAVSGAVTVQIVNASIPARNRQAEAALAVLRDMPQVASAQRVPDKELEELLKPWMGDVATGDSASDPIAIPALIDVTLRGAASDKALSAIQSRLASVAPSALVDAQSRWLQPVFAAIRSLQWLSLALIALLALAGLAAVWLAARSALGSNRETIEIIHHLGGTDAQIAGIFQRSVTLDAAIGAVVGVVLGLATVLILGQQFAELGSGMVSQGSLGWLDWLAIALVPIFGIVLAGMTARFTVMVALRRML